MTIAYVGIGSNLDPEAHVQEAVKALIEAFPEVACSPVYRTEAVGFEGPAFLNLVARFRSELPLEELMDRLRAIEDRFGRERPEAGYGNRTLDLDLLLFGDRVSRKPVTLPRQDILAYPFVAKPLADLEPRGRHPELGRTFAELWATFPPGAGEDLEPVDLDPCGDPG